MSGRLAGKRALITGAASGIGAAIAHAFAAEGARVLVTDIAAPAAEDLATRLCERFGAAAALSCRLDVTSEAGWNSALALAQSGMGGLSVLVNNAGIALGGTVENITLDDWRRVFAVNAEGTFLGCRLALPLLRLHQPAAIVNVASIAALIARPETAAYGAAKAAVCSLTRSVALHCAREGWDVRCNALLPAWVDTPLLDTILPSPTVPREKLVAALAREMPIGRLGTAAEVAQGALYLASDESRLLTGTELKLDGGASAM